MDTEKQRQHRRDDMRLTESGNTKSEQLLMMLTELMTKGFFVFAAFGLEKHWFWVAIYNRYIVHIIL